MRSKAITVADLGPHKCTMFTTVSGSGAIFVNIRRVTPAVANMATLTQYSASSIQLPTMRKSLETLSHLDGCRTGKLVQPAPHNEVRMPC